MESEIIKEENVHTDIFHSVQSNGVLWKCYLKKNRMCSVLLWFQKDGMYISKVVIIYREINIKE